MSDKITKHIEKIRKLQQYKDLDEDSLREIAEQHFSKLSLEQELEKLIGSDKEEVKEAKKRFDAYLAEFPIMEGEIERNGLLRLIYLEIIGLRLQKVLNQDTNSVSGKIHETYLENLKAQDEEKRVLGIIKKEDDKETELHKVLNELVRRQDAWINQADNRANYSIKTPCCGKWILIRRRLDKEKDTVLNHPWFVKGGILLNKHVFKLFDEGKISDEDVAEILQVKEKDYRLWLYKIYKEELKYNKEMDDKDV